ncbi:unnamed protein product [Adineta steineri]|uniref:Uncharacterized protein n=1 Tax=Adineta steineri TaxID=433720 RepID=A0A818G7Q3_9BILA|nr:unnamed protein product [Adineta steineri]CAF3485480.1 unnamed protein product [Adineta steineri]
MEKTDVSIENEEQVPVESKKVVDEITDDVPKKIEEPNDEIKIIENKNEDEVVPSTTPKQTEEQENVTEINTNIPACVSPGRVNVPFKEVNESEKEENTTPVNGTDNMNNNKKRELDNEDDQIQEKVHNNDDQTKKIKISEATENATVETKDSENNLAVNGTTATEVESKSEMRRFRYSNKALKIWLMIRFYL